MAPVYQQYWTPVGDDKSCKAFAFYVRSTTTQSVPLRVEDFTLEVDSADIGHEQIGPSSDLAGAQRTMALDTRTTAGVLEIRYSGTTTPLPTTVPPSTPGIVQVVFCVPTGMEGNVLDLVWAGVGTFDRQLTSERTEAASPREWTDWRAAPRDI